MFDHFFQNYSLFLVFNSETHNFVSFLALFFIVFFFSLLFSDGIFFEVIFVFGTG